MRRRLSRSETVLSLLIVVATLFALPFLDGRGGLSGIPGEVLAQGTAPPDIFSPMRYRHVGPGGKRVSAVVGVPGQPNIFYFGAASGGIFKSTDGGIHWTPIFDNQPVSSIGALALAPSESNIIWAGTGEAFIRSNISIGNGVYKSTDGGRTWAHQGLEKTGRIARIVIHPRDPNVVFVAAMGHCYGPQADRGVFRTTDGGKTWEKVLFVDENTGASDIAMDVNNPTVLFAGMWQVDIKTWALRSGGPGSGLFVSRDGGTTWKRLTGHGLPKAPLGKIAVAVARNNSNRVYALIETGDGLPWNGQETDSGTLWSSDDGGANWQLTNYDHNLIQRPYYYTRCVIAPDNYNEIYTLAVQLSVSLDGGKTFENAPGGRHGDNHDMWIDPVNGDRMIVGNDGGAMISVNRGQSWHRPQLPIAQVYHVTTDNNIPYNVYGNVQDGPSARGPSNSRISGGPADPAPSGEIPLGMWHAVGGGESGWTVPDPVDGNIVWSTASGYGALGGSVDRHDERTRQVRKVDVWPESPMGWGARDLKYRFQWSFPLAISPHNHEQVYTGSQYVHRTTDGGHSWQIISPDLTTNDKSKQEPSGGLTLHNTSPEYAPTIFAIAESPLEKGLIWVGTNDGLVQITRDAGAHWANVTSNIPNLPPWGTVSNIEPSRYDAGTAYVTIDLHQVNDRNPYVYKTVDFGKTWRAISSDIPRSVFSYAHCVREDPVRKGLLYLGTENAVYVSFNDGGSWIPLQVNLPHAPAHWLTVQEPFGDLVVATYGRGIWILDDITPLRQLTPAVLDARAHLFVPRPAYRLRTITEPESQPEDPGAGLNPPYGASINYYLKSAPEDEVTITVVDSNGQKVRTLKGTKNAGINRLWWDLRYEPSSEVRLRTSPPYAPWVRLGPQGWRPLVIWAGLGRTGPLVQPGTYTIKLSAGGSELTEKLTVKKDPNSAGTEQDIGAQVKLLLESRENMNAVADMINQIEWVRRQLYDLDERLRSESNTGSIRGAAEELDKKLIAVEDHLFQMKVTGPGQDFVRWPNKLVERIPLLVAGVEIADFPPTTQQLEVHKMYTDQIAGHRSRLNEVFAKDLAAFNEQLAERKLSSVMVVK
ncbi:MAG: sialidase [Acidobacteria bacterium]|nr:sialidase [Acidobacteriota bacterium]